MTPACAPAVGDIAAPSVQPLSRAVLVAGVGDGLVPELGSGGLRAAQA